MAHGRSAPLLIALALVGGCQAPLVTPGAAPGAAAGQAQLPANRTLPATTGDAAPPPPPGMMLKPKPTTIPLPDAGPVTSSSTSAASTASPTVGIAASLATPLLRTGNVPQTIAAAGNPGLAAVDATNLYVIDGAGTTVGAAGTTLKAQPLNGAAAMTLATAAIVCFCRVGTDLYYATATAIAKIGTNGLGGASVSVGQTAIRAIAADATTVYFLDGGAGTGDGSLKSVGVGGGAITTLANGLIDPKGLAIDGTNAYIADRGTGNNGTIKKVPLLGGAVTTLATNQPAPWSVSVDATTVYFANAPTGGNGDLRKVAITGGGVTVLVSAMTASQPLLAVDGTHLYYLEGNAASAATTAGSVRRVALTGGNPFLMATQLNHPIGLALDGGTVYYALPSTASALMKVAK